MIRSLIFALVVVSADGFLGVRPQPLPHRAYTKLYAKDQGDMMINPMEGYQGVDIERARLCAENFGACTVEEMEMLKSSKLGCWFGRWLGSHAIRERYHLTVSSAILVLRYLLRST